MPVGAGQGSERIPSPQVEAVQISPTEASNNFLSRGYKAIGSMIERSGERVAVEFMDVFDSFAYPGNPNLAYGAGAIFVAGTADSDPVLSLIGGGTLLGFGVAIQRLRESIEKDNSR